VSALLRERESRTNDERRRRTPRNAILHPPARRPPTTYDGWSKECRNAAPAFGTRPRVFRRESDARTTRERLSKRHRSRVSSLASVVPVAAEARVSREKNPPGFSSLATCAASDARERFSGGTVDVPLVTQNDTAHVEAAWRWRGGFAKRGRGQRRQRGSGRWIRESARHLPETLNDKRPPRHGNGRLGPRARSAGPRARVESVSMTRTEWIRRP
jgi:hypothetical protein